MDHAEALGLIEAYADGELDTARAAAFETHLESCASCREALDAWMAERNAVRSALDLGSAPQALRERIRAATVDATPRRRSAPAWAMQAAALAGVAILSSGATFAVMQTAHQDRIQTLFDATMRAEDPGRRIEIASTDKHTVKPWLDQRLDFAPPVDNFAAQGFPLIGGRLDYVEGRRAAVLVYGRRKHFIDVYLRPSGDAPAPPASADRRGFHLIGWRHAGFDYWAVSDVDASELKALHSLLDSPPPSNASTPGA
ncbi:MAG TPA: anti-sigma factor [Caulobacteraceae bacterium]|jgi:anti-sigma factor RsiW|nr:anti-sigma factor [Caulobacteraceae bacterium]